MGIVKAWMMEMEERGYGDSDEHICAACVTDDFLTAWICENAENTTCSFCSAKSAEPIATSFEDFTGVVIGGIGFDWNEPTSEGIVYESREGGWQASLSTTLDILYDIGISENEDVIKSLSGMIVCDAWVEREYYRGSESQRFLWGWDNFKTFTKHDTRFFFLQNKDDDDDELSPGDMLAIVSNIVRSKLAKGRFIRPLGTDTEIIRIRVADEPHSEATALGAPKPEHATQSNRMSPAGIPMFYGAFNYATAYAETFDINAHAGKILSAGTFRPTRELMLLDLADLLPVPSIFDVDQHQAIHSLRFLHDFASDISQPIARDSREHIEYVPTQIVTEYFRRIFRFDKARHLDGIIYRSAKLAGQAAIVLFCENHQAINLADAEGSDTLLRLISVSP